MTDDDLPLIVSANVPGPASLALARRLRAVESPDTTFLSPDFPVFWTKAQGCLVEDVDGNRFLDLTSSFGVLGVGHRHPRVMEAIARQSNLLVHGMGDVHPSDVKVELLEAIASRSPLPDPLITLGLNGSDAVEAALKTALLATGRPGVLGFTGGYHGLSYGSLEPTERAFFSDPFKRQLGRFAFHLPFGAEPAHVRDALDQSAVPIGAVIVEPIQGRGGIRIPPADWLRQLRRICTDTGALLVFDEIFTGWGRTGSWFACIQESVVPDLMCIGKGMGGGMPISACIGEAALMEQAWQRSTGEARHTYTFLGHPLSCAAASATIRVLDEEGLVERSRTLGARMLADLTALAMNYPNLCTSVRGRGMMLAVEFVQPEVAWSIVLSGLSKGLILLPAGDRGQVIEIVPPFVITDRQSDWSLDVFGKLLHKISRSK